MPYLGDDDILQSNSGGFTAASGAATLAATTAGTTVIVVAFTYGTTIATPTGFTQDSPAVGANQQALYVFRKPDVAGGETSWTLTLGASAPCSWVAYEIQSLDLADPVVAVSPYTVASAQAASTGSTPSQASYDSLYLAAHGAYDATSATPPTWSGHTESFTELHDQGQAGTGVAVGLSVSDRLIQAVDTYSVTATSNLAAAGPVAGVLIGYTSAWAKRVGGYNVFHGYEWGSGDGLTAGTTGFKHFFSALGSPTITNLTPRTGSYCLELSATSSTCSLTTTVATNEAIYRMPFRLVGTPSTDVQLFSFITGTVACVVWYRSATQKLGVVISGGVEQASVATVSADAWHVIELRFKVNTSDYTADWQLDGVDQTQATSTQTPGSAVSTHRLGWAASATATIRVDDDVVSTIANNYPMGDHKVVGLKVDPAGTLTVNGATSRFNTWTDNGTMANWDATAARNAIDERPPTIGATSDGVAVVTSSSTGHVEIPMETYSISSAETPRSGKLIVAGWAATADPAADPTTLKFEAWDGTAATTVWIDTTTSFDNVDTTWMQRGFSLSAGWSQATLDALAFRMYSNDATPDVGIHAIYAEILIAIAQTEVLFGEPGSVYVQAHRDPITNGLLGFTVTTPVGKAATINYEVDGVAQTPVSVAANSSQTVNLQAPDFPTINKMELVPG